jgi:hypothetical protein
MIRGYKKKTVINKLKPLGDTDRMILLNKYVIQMENVYCDFSAKVNIDIITKIFLFKFNRKALIYAYVTGDHVVDHPSCRLSEFLDNELVKLRVRR